MKEYSRYAAGNLSNVLVLNGSGCEDDWIGDHIETTCDRLLHAALALPEGEFLGVQFSLADAMCAHFFTSPGATAVSESDVNWIFAESKLTGGRMYPQMQDIFGENRVVYQLKAVTADPESEYVACTQCTDCVDCLLREHYIRRFFEMRKEEGMIVQISATGGGGSEDSRCGTVLLSFPEKMSFQAAIEITMIFPCTRICEITKSDAEGGVRAERLSGRYMKGSAKLFLCNFVHKHWPEENNPKNDAQEDADDDEAFYDELFDSLSGEDLEFNFGEVADDLTDEDAPDDDAGENAGTPIEELDLSVRSYNGLKRAGINTVEQLQLMNFEDLRKVRNLGRKSISEIEYVLHDRYGFSFQKEQVSGQGQAAGQETDRSSAEQLEELIGLAEVKNQVKRITAFARMQKAFREMDRKPLSLTLNMSFVGNPGTAKTTVARIVAGIFHEYGLLPSAEMIEVGRAGLVGQYLGETAVKVREVFRHAEGKLLFIDEAYSLVDGYKSAYGDEAISTIVQEMENRRDRTIVVFAGYPDKMKEFFKRNPGLRSRVPFEVAFPDYSAEEMLQIVNLEVEKRGFRTSWKARKVALSLCEEARAKEDSGNGRFCRNLVDNAILGYAARVFAIGKENPKPDFVLQEEDFTLPSAQLDPSSAKKNGEDSNDEPKRIIGFTA